MPLYTYVCTSCQAQFETLVRGDDQPVCPSCGSTSLTRQIGTIAPDAKLPGQIQAARRQAAREGHFSNYSRSERRGK